MNNQRIILYNYSKGSYGHIFKDIHMNVYKITKISDNGLINASNINEIIILNYLKIINNKLLDNEIENNNNLDELIKIDKESYKKCIKKNYFMQSKTGYYNRKKFENRFSFTDAIMTSKYFSYFCNKVDKFVIISKMPLYKSNFAKFVEKEHIYCIKNFNKLSKKIIKSLAILHHNGFLHGDLKSANILINDNDSICLSDFGAIKIKNFDKYYLSCTITTRCPEDLEYEYDKNKYFTNTNDKSDIWSLGLILAEMLLGYNPIFKLYQELEKTETDIDNLEKQLIVFYKTVEYIDILELVNISPIKNHLSEIHYKQIEIIEKMLRINPNERLENIEEVYEKLFNEKLNINFHIDFSYNYDKYNIDNFFDKLTLIRTKYYKNIIVACDKLNILHICPFIFDILDRLFIKIYISSTDNCDNIHPTDIYFIFSSVILIASGLINQSHPPYYDLLFVFKISETRENLKFINDNLLKILILLEYDIYRPFNIFLCNYYLNNECCNCNKQINTNYYTIHNNDQKKELIIILENIITDNIIGVSPEYYYNKLKA
jgi:serine/threonine protein kinase